jgi:hypothetical protein
MSRLLTVLAILGVIAAGWSAPAKAGPMIDPAAVADGMQCCDSPQSMPDSGNAAALPLWDNQLRTAWPHCP